MTDGFQEAESHVFHSYFTLIATSGYENPAISKVSVSLFSLCPTMEMNLIDSESLATVMCQKGRFFLTHL